MKIIIKNLQKKIPIDPKRIKRLALKVLSLEWRKKPGEITICFSSDKFIKELNLMYLGQDCATDVISFDNSLNSKELLADIAISADTAIRQAKIFQTTAEYEVLLYLAHGLLHLLGYDDRTPAQKKVMDKKSTQILSTFKL